MRIIEDLTVVTEQGVSTYSVGTCGITEISEATYRVTGDPYPCFHVMKGVDVVAEIRCVHQCKISYSSQTPTEQEVSE